jgi:hypothetical protein
MQQLKLKSKLTVSTLVFLVSGQELVKESALASGTEIDSVKEMDLVLV